MEGEEGVGMNEEQRRERMLIRTNARDLFYVLFFLSRACEARQQTAL